MFYTHTFAFKTFSRTLPDMPDIDCGDQMDNAVVVFFHVEAEDMENRAKVVRKFVKNTKWLCGKFKTANVILHSFNHLSSSKATPEFSKGILDEVARRLADNDFSVKKTPFGYFNEFNMHVAGDSLAKVFKEF